MQEPKEFGVAVRETATPKEDTHHVRDAFPSKPSRFQSQYWWRRGADGETICSRYRAYRKPSAAAIRRARQAFAPFDRDEIGGGQ